MIKPTVICYVVATGIDHQSILVQLLVIQSIGVPDHGLNAIIQAHDAGYAVCLSYHTGILIHIHNVIVPNLTLGQQYAHIAVP
jgi:hypothetical protein